MMREREKRAKARLFVANYPIFLLERSSSLLPSCPAVALGRSGIRGYSIPNPVHPVYPCLILHSPSQHLSTSESQELFSPFVFFVPFVVNSFSGFP